MPAQGVEPRVKEHMSRPKPSAQKEPEPTWHKSVVRDYFESLCIAVIFALFVRTFVFQAFKIPSKSMEDNLLVGDHIVVDKFGFAPRPRWLEGVLPYRHLARGNVLVFKFPRDPERDFIKRAIGTPGDEIQIDGATVMRNGEVLDESYAVYKNPFDAGAGGEPQERNPLPGRRFGVSVPGVAVPPGRYFVMGDNRYNSEDSRYWGTVPEQYVKGRALFIYWSFDVPKELQYVEVSPQVTPADRSKLLRYTLIHFFDKSRWSRTFRVIR